MGWETNVVFQNFRSVYEMLFDPLIPPFIISMLGIIWAYINTNEWKSKSSKGKQLIVISQEFLEPELQCGRFIGDIIYKLMPNLMPNDIIIITDENSKLLKSRFQIWRTPWMWFIWVFLIWEESDVYYRTYSFRCIRSYICIIFNFRFNNWRNNQTT